jgi:hypothetical protein
MKIQLFTATSALPEHPNDAVFVQQWVARGGLGAYKGGQLQARWSYERITSVKKEGKTLFEQFL